MPTLKAEATTWSLTAGAQIEQNPNGVGCEWFLWVLPTGVQKYSIFKLPNHLEYVAEPAERPE